MKSKKRWAPLFGFALLLGCAGEAPPQDDPNVSTQSGRDEMTTDDYGNLDPSEVGNVISWTRGINKQSGAEESMLAAVHAEETDAFGRVVFTFEGGLPGYQLAIQSGQDGQEACPSALEDPSPARLAIRLGTQRRSAGFDIDAAGSVATPCGEAIWIVELSRADATFRVIETADWRRLVVDYRYP